MQSLSSQIYEYCGRGGEARVYTVEPKPTMTNLCQLYPSEAEILIFAMAIMVSLMIAFGLPTFYIYFWGLIQKIKEDRQAKRIKRYYDLIQNRPRDEPAVIPTVPAPIQQVATPTQPSAMTQTAVIEPMPRRVQWSEDYLRPPPSYERSLLMDGRRFGSFYPQSLRLEIPTKIYPDCYQIPSRNYENVRLRDLTTPLLERAVESEPALPAPSAD
jgi:hypothetical protein